MNVTDRRSLSKALARTHGGDRDGWERVKEYQRVLDYAAKHPEQKSQAISTGLDLPRERIRSWVDADGRPDPVRTVQTAEDHGWLDLDWRCTPFSGLNQLVAWVFSGGSVSKNYTPRFAFDNETDRSRVAAAFNELGIGYRVIEREESRAPEVEPTAAARTLGRLLVVLGAPQGGKSREASLTLPAYLDDAPDRTRLQFAQTYVRNRAVARPDLDETPVQFKEQRPESYRSELKRFLADVVGEEGSVVGSTTIRLDRRAAAMLCEEFAFGDD
jgi:hypothetical protein